MAFVHLHNHTQYSMLDGACRVDRMVSKAVSYGMEAVAMTDHGNMFGVIDFVTHAEKAGIKPIVGIETYIVNGSLSDQDSKQKRRNHLVLLVKNQTGYRNLIKLSSMSFIDGFYYNPRISKELLAQHAEGLICLSACLHGEIPYLLLQGQFDEAVEVVEFYKSLFGEDFFIELMDHGLEDEKVVLPELIRLATQTDTPMVMTNDCHYLDAQDAEAHDILLCIQTNSLRDEPDRFRYNTDQLYFKSEEEMRSLLPDMSEPFDNTVEIAKRVDFTLPYDKPYLPRGDVPEKYESADEYLKDLCEEGAKKIYGEITPEIRERLDYELKVIIDKQYVDYFLVVKDFIDKAREMEIPVGPGRGSAAGSIVSYVLDITRLDPLKYGLLFERFLDLNRVSMPDIDIDFCAEGRGQVIDYVVNKYGRKSVSQIITFTTLGAKSVLKDVARTLEIPAAESGRITKVIPDGTKSLDDALREVPEFTAIMESSQLYRDVLRYSLVLEGLVRQIGVHPAGVVIGPGELWDHVPLAVSRNNKVESVVVQYEGKWLDDLKMLKMDFLGLKTLTIISKTVKLVEEVHGVKLDPETFPLDDPKPYELLSKGHTDGVFQFESGGMKKNLIELKPNQFEDIIAMVALYRPGPMQFIPNYIRRKHGEEIVEYDHPLTEETLRETYGVTVYQEQVMQIAKRMAGFDAAEAGKLRKAISKKRKKEMAELYEAFLAGSLENGVPKKTVEKIWSDWQEFANYAFNKSHAACYALVAYRTAWLKSHYPVEFMAAILSQEDNPDKVPYFLDECRKMGIEVIPPRINTSHEGYFVKDGKIVFGFRGIKNVGTSAIRAIIAERQERGEFRNIFDFCDRVDTMVVNKAVIESLISAGAMDDLEGNRAQQIAVLESAMEHGSFLQSEKKRGQMMLFDLFEEEQPEEEAFLPEMPDVPDWTYSQKLEHEKRLMGFYMSGHPLHEHKVLVNLFTNTATNALQKGNIPDTIRIMGIVSTVQRKRSRKGNQFGIVTFEDLHGKFEIALFDSNYDQWFTRMEQGGIFFIQGRRNLGGDESVLKIQPQRIIPMEEMGEKLTGDAFFTLKGERLDRNLGQRLSRLATTGNGGFRIHFIVKTDRFRTLKLEPRGMRLFPDDDFFTFIEEYLDGAPAVRLEN